MEKQEIEVPPVRVKFYNEETDEQELGTVIDSSPNYWIVIPDDDMALSQRWPKMYCDILR